MIEDKERADRILAMIEENVRLRALNAELVAALEDIADGADAKAFVRSTARAALAKAKEQT